MGYSVDVIREIFSKHGIKFTLEIIPWKRCQAKVDEGDQYQMLLSGGYNSDRAKKYHLTQIYYGTTYAYFWSKKHHPNGLDIGSDSATALADLVYKYQMAAILGYGMGVFKTAGIDLSSVDDGAKDYKALVSKLLDGRVDVFTEGHEIIAGLYQVGKLQHNILEDTDIGSAPIPGIKSRGYHMMISKKHPVGLKLRGLIDQELTLMDATGRLDEILRKYIPNQ